jgi:predicted RNA-binding Zn ribbon-like protein
MTRPDLGLDFANTRFWRGSAESTETLRNPDDLRAWCRSEGLPDRPWDEAALADALALREAVYRIFAAAAAGAGPAEGDLERLNAALAAAPARTRLRRRDGGYDWAVERLATAPLAPVAWSAADLLTSPRLARVRLCANEKCRWVFLDDSKSGNRRWCSMSACGNRAKAHRHYARRKAI